MLCGFVLVKFFSLNRVLTTAHYFTLFFIPSRLKFLRMTVFDSGDFSSPFDDAERAGTAGVCLHLEHVKFRS